MTEVDRAFCRLERRSERLLAGIRLLALLVLAVVFRLVAAADQGYPTMVPLGGLIAITLITPLLARRRLFRPWILWVFASLDVGLLAHCLVMLAGQNGQPLQEAHLRGNLSRYFSPQLVDEIAQAGTAARSFRSQKAAILFLDLRGFTGLAEGMPADQVAEFLNEFRRRIAEPIARHRGVIDKFIGDGAMAIFGVPEPGADDARHAVLAGLDLLSAIGRWHAERVAEGLSPVAIGIGIHYGDVIAGALGDEQRLEYTVVGDAVNTAARIERLTADLGTPLLVSADVLAAPRVSGRSCSCQRPSPAPCAVADSRSAFILSPLLRVERMSTLIGRSKSQE